MKLSDYIASFLVSKDIRVVFGYIGGMITHLVDSIDRNPKLKFIQTYHEQTASIAAEGYALESGKFGVAIATSGPGATNMVTGIADAFFGSIPVLYITGQVNTYEYKYGKPIRQQGFQETDVVSIVRPITKYATMVDNPNQIRYELEKCLYIATHGRKGPVLIDLPMDISRAEINPERLSCYVPPPTNSEINMELEKILRVVRSSKRPMVLVGGGCRGYGEMLMNFIRKHRLPVVTSLMGRGIIDESYPLYMGMIGSYGLRCANMAFRNVDLLLALGSRMDTRQTGARYQDFVANGFIIQVDIDELELNFHRLKNRIPVHSDVAEFIRSMNESNLKFCHENSWLSHLQDLRYLYSQKNEIDDRVKNKVPYHFMLYLGTKLSDDAVVTTDVGQNQMWAAQALSLRGGQSFLTSGGLAPMGFSLPAAIGVSFASPQKTVYCLNGDGGFHIALQAVQLISQYSLNIKVIIINNSSLGMITQFQHLYFADNMAGTTKAGGYIVPEIKHLAKAYGLPYVKIVSSDFSPLDDALRQQGPIIIELLVDGLTTVCPKLEYNMPIYNPSPQINTQG